MKNQNVTLKCNEAETQFYGYGSTLLCTLLFMDHRLRMTHKGINTIESWMIRRHESQLMTWSIFEMIVLPDKIAYKSFIFLYIKQRRHNDSS